MVPEEKNKKTNSKKVSKDRMSKENYQKKPFSCTASVGIQTMFNQKINNKIQKKSLEQVINNKKLKNKSSFKMVFFYVH